MSVPRIFTPQALREGGELVLEEAASRHLASALRLQLDAQVILFNASGGEFQARIKTLDRKRVSLQVVTHNPVERESPLHTHLGIAVSRGERMDWVVQKATELGVNTISPLFSERTEVKLKSERAEKKVNHWQQVAVSACEQCGRNQVPRIAPLQQLSNWLPTVEAECKLVLHHRNSNSLRELGPPNSVALLIGPEGGLSDLEIANASAVGFSALALGPRILRTETAPLAALSLLQQQWGDMN